ncbi:MAG: GNAT family N-acetyltransferase [Saprospiraceae bacterium]|nr:GNAT family N-acetyltransferase [Candidatus Vicinibacter affinis]
MTQSREFITRVQKEIDSGVTILWVISERNPKIHGTICLWNISETILKAELGYTLVPEYHNLGYMSEALERVLEFGFKVMKLKTIEALPIRTMQVQFAF